MLHLAERFTSPTGFWQMKASGSTAPARKMSFVSYLISNSSTATLPGTTGLSAVPANFLSTRAFLAAGVLLAAGLLTNFEPSAYPNVSLASLFAADELGAGAEASEPASEAESSTSSRFRFLLDETFLLEELLSRLLDLAFFSFFSFFSFLAALLGFLTTAEDGICKSGCSAVPSSEREIV